MEWLSRLQGECDRVRRVESGVGLRPALLTALKDDMLKCAIEWFYTDPEAQRNLLRPTAPVS